MDEFLLQYLVIDNPKYIPVTYFQVYIDITSSSTSVKLIQARPHTEKIHITEPPFSFTKYAHYTQSEICNSDTLTHDPLQQTTDAQLQL
jgi:hypothetical protein